MSRYSSWTVTAGASSMARSNSIIVIELSASAKERRDYLRRKNRAYTTIFLCIEENLRTLIEGTKEGKEAWRILRENFEPSTRARLAALIDEFFNINYNQGEGTMGEYISRVNGATTRLMDAGFRLPDLLISFQMIRRLPKEYEGIVQILYRVIDAEFTPAKVQEALLAEYDRVELRKQDEANREVSGAMALVKGNPMRNKPRKDKPIGARPAQERGEKEITPAYKSKLTGACYACGKRGHYARACPSRGTTAALQATAGETSDEGEINGAFYVPSALNAIQRMAPEQWIVDTAVSDHFCGKKEWFENYRETPQSTALGATERMSATVEGRGDIRLRVRVGQRVSSIVLKNVLYTPQMRHNLISGSRIDAGYRAVIGDRKYEVYTPSGALFFVAPMMERFYVLKGVITKSEPAHMAANITAETNETDSYKEKESRIKTDIDKWHSRLGHVNTGTIKHMITNKSVRGLSITGKSEIGTCDTCKVAKFKRTLFKRDYDRITKAPLERVYVDTCGPLNSVSPGGAKYFLSIVDDYTRRIFIYPMKKKSETFELFTKFMKTVERQTEREIKYVRSDNGSEFCSKTFENLFDSKGITHELTNTYTPEQNGICE